MRKFSAVFCAALALALGPIASADFQVASSSEEPASAAGIEHRHFNLRDSNDGGSVTMDLALFSGKSAALRIIDNASGLENLAGALVREKCLAGVNGAFFDPDFKPLGLRIIDSATTSPLTRGRLLTGILCGSSRGIEIVRVGEFSRRRNYSAAIECGPLVIDLGARVHGLDNSRNARRTFAAVARGGNAALGISSDLTLNQLGAALGNLPDFKIWRALNLDGGSSSGFWLKRRDGSVLSIEEEKRVRDFVGIVAR